MKIKYDYIICGAGLSGLILANKIFEDSDFDNKQILIIEKNLSNPLNHGINFFLIHPILKMKLF